MWYILNFKDHTFYSADGSNDAEQIIIEQAKKSGIDELEVVNGFIDESRYSARDWGPLFLGHSIKVPALDTQPPEPKRMFLVDTPVGKIKVWAKSDCGKPTDGADDPEDFPGIYIDLVRGSKHPDTMLACIEWESCDKQLQACLYAHFNEDEPTTIETYDIEELERIEAEESKAEETNPRSEYEL